MIQIAPSILAANFAKLGEEVKKIEDSGADRIHFDVMDGCFVPSLSFGPMVLAAIRPYSKLPMDVHLMVTHPENHIKPFADAGADSITIHIEATNHVDALLREIKQLGKQCGVSLNPGTPIYILENVFSLADIILVMSVNPGKGGQQYIHGMTEKIRKLHDLIISTQTNVEVHVDGGIGPGNAQMITDAGANVLITGSSFFSSQDKRSFISEMKGMTSRNHH